MTSQFSMEQFLDLDLEYRLTHAKSIMDGCNCSKYLLSRRDVVLPAIYEQAAKEKLEPIDVFIRFRNNLHAKLCPGTVQIRMMSQMLGVEDA